MKIQFTGPFDREYSRLPDTIKDRVNKQIETLASDPGHPSLRIKKMAGSDDIWEARVTRGYRMTFQIVADTAILRRVGSHNILRNP